MAYFGRLLIPDSQFRQQIPRRMPRGLTIQILSAEVPLLTAQIHRFLVICGSAFLNNYALEDRFDGGVLEISVDAGPFQDILAAGGGFLRGGYNGNISTCCGNPLAGRQAWTGNSGGFIDTDVDLGNFGGHTVRYAGAWRVTQAISIPVKAGGSIISTLCASAQHRPRLQQRHLPQRLRKRRQQRWHRQLQLQLRQQQRQHLRLPSRRGLHPYHGLARHHAPVRLRRTELSNQSMKPTASPRNAFSVFATTPCRGLSLSR